MDDLLKDAIADAKAVRETALANAKIALEEAFTPRIQSMLSDKIQSEVEGEEHEDADEGEDHDEIADADEGEGHEDADEGEYHEEEEPVVADEEEVPAEVPAEEPAIAVEPEAGEEVADEIEDEESPVEGVIEIDGVKYAPVVSEEEEAPADDEMEMEGEEEEGDDLDLESILRELEEEDEEGEPVEEEYDENAVGDGLESDEVETAPEAELAENDVSSDIGDADNKVNAEAGDSSKTGAPGPEGEGSDKPAGKENAEDEVVDDLTEDLDLEEVLKALTEGDDEEDEEDDKVEELNTLKADIEEHRNVVKYLRGKLNEVNLLNAKLLFTNKLFRNFGLNNEQKLKVVETFDRATNLREVKLVFSTLAESFGNKVASKPSKPIKESKGTASKAVASTKPKTEKVISEGFDMKERFQKLAKIL